MHTSVGRRIRPGFVIVLAGLLAVTAAAYSFQLVSQAHATSRAEADLATAAAQLAQVDWAEGFAASDDDMCPNETRCLTTDRGPDEALEQGLAALEAAGFKREPMHCEDDVGLGTGCHGQARLGRAAVAVAAGHDPPTGGSLVMISEPFAP